MTHLSHNLLEFVALHLRRPLKQKPSAMSWIFSNKMNIHTFLKNLNGARKHEALYKFNRL